MDINSLKLFRKRYVPMELLHLKNDHLISLQDNVLLTRWDTIKPRKDIAHGISAYFLKDGFKVSKVFNHLHEPVYWYCDIINAIVDEENNEITSEDLLLDVVIYPDKTVRVLDVAETAEAFESGIITKEQLIYAMNRLDKLLSLIYSGKFATLQSYLDNIE